MPRLCPTMLGSIALLLSLCVAVSAQQQDTALRVLSDTSRKATRLPNVAVNDLMPHGVSASDAAIVSEQLRAELVGTRKFRVMERGQMDQILKEQAFQQSGACDNSECAVEVGKLLAVDRMVSGSMGRIGELYTLQTHLLDVQTGEVLFSASQSFEGRIEDLLARAVPKLASRLANGTSQGKGDIFVSADRPGVEVFVDGERKGATPLSLPGMVAGDHRIEARQGNLYALQEVTLRPDDVQRLELKLEPGMGSLKVYSDPPGARATLDNGRDLGLTPLRVDRIPMGTHTVSLFLDSAHLPQTITVSIPAQGMGTVNGNLFPGALVSMAANAMSSVMLRCDSTGDSTRFRASSRMWLRSGHWSVLGDAGPEYLPFRDTLTVRPGTDLHFELVFHRTPRWLDSVARAEHQSTLVRWRWATGVAAVAAAAAGSWFHFQASKVSDDAEQARARYAAASSGFEGLWQDYQNAKSRNRTDFQRALAADVLAGLLAAGFGWTFAF